MIAENTQSVTSLTEAEIEHLAKKALEGHPTIPGASLKGILKALKRVSDWRIPYGIAMDSGLSEEQVELFVDELPELFEEVPIRLAGERVIKLNQDWIASQL